METFWNLVADSLRHSPGRSGREVFLRRRLAALPPAGIVRFQVHLENATDRACTWDLRGAGTRIFAGWLSDDGFEYFRYWLVGRGRDVFERAVAEPDALAGIPEISRLADQFEPRM